MQQYDVVTSHGRIAVRDTGSDGPSVLLLHGNSSTGAIFRNQLSAFGERYRLLAPDLPGHGASADATDPERSYSIPGYAEAMLEVLERLELGKAVVFGWSLGGHVGIDMIPRYPGLQALMITGTPPASLGDMAQAFKPLLMNLAGKENFTAEDVQTYAEATSGKPYEPFLHEAVARTDGRARKMMLEHVASGKLADQARIVASATISLAVVNGAEEPFVETGFVARQRYGRLWEGTCHLIAGSGHAPFWDAPAQFNGIFARFLEQHAGR